MTQYILEAAATVAIVIITRYVVPYIKGKIALIDADKLSMQIDTAVRAAEQKIQGSKLGAEKKAFVVGLLTRTGVVVNDMVEAMIEAAVKAMNDELITITDAVVGEIKKAGE